MHPGQRVILHTTDISTSLDNYRASAVPLVYTSGQYLYIGSEVPMTNLWFELGTPSTEDNRALTVQVWWAQAWTDVIDLSDGTSTGTARAMGQSGRVSWGLRWDRGWDWEIRTNLMSGLSSFEIYDLYWCRLSWSGSLSAGLTVKYIGQRFAGDTELATYYPDLRNQNLKTAFGGISKTTWTEQAFAASECVVRDLIARRVIRDRGQIVDWRLFVDPTVHKMAEIIYRGLGPAHRDDAQAASRAYAESMKLENFRVDKTGKGRLDTRDKRDSKTFMER